MTLRKIIQGLRMPSAFMAAFSILSPVSEAAIIYSGIENVALSHSSNDTAVMTMGGIGTSFVIRDSRGGFVVRRDEFVSPYPYSIVMSDGWTSSLSFGHSIYGGLDWSDMPPSTLLRYEEPDYGTGDFFDQSDKFIAIRILDDTDVYYGWIRISHSIADHQLVIHDWAWNSVAGAPIMAGVIPEPATLAFFAGLFGLGSAFFFRRRRK